MNVFRNHDASRWNGLWMVSKPRITIGAAVRQDPPIADAFGEPRPPPAVPRLDFSVPRLDFPVPRLDFQCPDFEQRSFLMVDECPDLIFQDHIGALVDPNRGTG